MLAQNRSWSFILTIVLLTLTLPACSMVAEREAPTGTPAGPLLLYEDDFSDETSGWLEATDAQASQGYRDGKFLFKVQALDLFVWDNAGGNWQDFVLKVKARQVSGDPENSYGVLVRYVDDGNFYRFDLTGDGYYAAFKLENEEWNTVADWQASAHIKPQGGVNLIKIVCRGAKMILYANGQELLGLEDSSFERGDAGLFASTFANPDDEVEFDDLEVWKPE